MLRMRAQADVNAIDVRPFIAALPVLVRRWRALRFEQGVFIDANGRPREGLRVERGSHPLPGTSYRVVVGVEQTTDPAEHGAIPQPEPMDAKGFDQRPAFERRSRQPQVSARPGGRAETLYTTTLIEILGDDRRRLDVRLRDLEGSYAAEVQLHRPDRPERIIVDVRRTIEPIDWHWLIGGPIAVHVCFAPDQLPPAGGSTPGTPPLVAEVRHPRGNAAAEMRVQGAGRGSWTIVVDVRARGRGLARPIVAVLAPLVWRYLRPEFELFVAQLPKSVDELKHVAYEEFGGNPGPEQLADELFDGFLSGVVEHVPPDLRSRPRG
jgi:hypothetical protein